MNFLHVLDGHLSGLLIRLIRGTLVWIQNKRRFSSGLVLL